MGSSNLSVGTLPQNKESSMLRKLTLRFVLSLVTVAAFAPISAVPFHDGQRWSSASNTRIDLMDYVRAQRGARIAIDG